MSYVNNEEFAEAVKNCQRELYRLALAITKNDADAQDAVSEAIIKAYENRNSLKDYNKFKTWIMKILVNVSKTLLKKKQRVVLMDDVWKLREPLTEKPDEMWDIVMELEREFREVIILYYYEGLPIKEISQMLGISEGTVKSRLARARAKLKFLL